MALGSTLEAIKGRTFTDQTAALFVDPDGADDLSHYFAGIDWGDGSLSSSGNITFDDLSGIFSVSGSHTYLEEGAFPVVVTIHRDNGLDAIVHSLANVASLIVAGEFAMTAIEGSDSGYQTLAAFTDVDGPGALADYAADIDWGDGETSKGFLAFNEETEVFTVSGSHPYLEEGVYPVEVSIRHADSSFAVKVISVAYVDDPAVIATGGFEIEAIEGHDFIDRPVASFTDPGGAQGFFDYAADVDWGDGSNSEGSIVFDPETSVFTVSGGHAYAEEGDRLVTVTIHHDSAPVLVHRFFCSQKEAFCVQMDTTC